MLRFVRYVGLFLFLFLSCSCFFFWSSSLSSVPPHTLHYKTPNSDLFSLSLSNLEMVPKTPYIHLPNPSRKHTSSRRQQFRRLQTNAHRPSIRRHRSSDTLHFPRSNFLHTGFHHRLVAVGRELFEKAQSRGPDVGESGHEDIFAHV